MSTLTIGSVVFGPAAPVRETVQEPRPLVYWLRLHRDHGEITDTTKGGTRVLTCECGASHEAVRIGPSRPAPPTSRQGGPVAVSVRKRFEVFKRDDFTCRYCGRTSPAVVLEVDHIVPKAEGGSDDEMNLATSCWECNHGKSDVPLREVMTGEDPHDKAILLLERDRQLREYNEVLGRIREGREEQAWWLWRRWKNNDSIETMPRCELSWLVYVLEECPSEIILHFIDGAVARDKGWPYVKACVRNWREQQGVVRHG
jgi:hypothetical protein